jgi:hypothetical protein
VKHLLRLLGFCVLIVTLLTYGHFISLGARKQLTPLVYSGAPGALAVVNWLLIMLVGPIAAVQMLRLERSGRYLTIFLCACAFLYHFLGFLAWRTAQTPLFPIYEALAWNLAVIVVLLTPAARRIA